MQAAILAGGLGTRLRPLTDRMPKAMVPVNGRPFLEYELDLLKSCGVGDVVLCVGYLGEQIEAHFGDGKRFGLRIRYGHDGKELLGPIGGLKAAERWLEDRFFVTYGDAYLRLDYRGLMDSLTRSRRLGVMAIWKNDGSLGKRDVAVRDGFVTAFDKKRTLPEMEWTNFGATAMKKAALDGVSVGEHRDEESFYQEMISRRQLLAFETRERYYEIGSETGLAAFCKFISSPSISKTRPSGQRARY